MATSTDYVQAMRELAQPHVPEPVVAASILQPAGSMGNLGLGKISPLAAMIMKKKANKKAGGLARDSAFSTEQAFIVVTAHRVYAFNSKRAGREWKVLDPVGSWDRNDLTVTKTPGKLTTKVALDIGATGEHYELEATTMADQGVSSALLEAL
jgi:hypothetical protein